MENKKNQIKDKVFKKILNRIMKHFNLKFNQILFNYCDKLLRNCTAHCYNQTCHYTYNLIYKN